MTPARKAQLVRKRNRRTGRGCPCCGMRLTRKRGMRSPEWHAARLERSRKLTRPYNDIIDSLGRRLPAIEAED